MSEYTHIQELLHETKRLLAEAVAKAERLRVELIEAQDTIHGCELVIDNQKAIIDRNAWRDSRTSDEGLDGADTAT